MSAGAISNDTLNDALLRAKQLATVSTNPSTTKRPSSDDLNLYPSKRANGGNMAGMAMGSSLSDHVVETIQVPDNAVGLVIGRGGEQITSIQQQSGCRVQMAQDSQGQGFRVCTLQGSRPCIDRARQLIQDVLSRSRNHHQQGNGSFGGGGNQQMVTQELLIPGSKCGLIIGKNGETIKGLQEQIGVKMLLIQDSQTVSQQPKPLRITGSVDKVEQAKRMVEQLISDGGPGNSGMVGMLAPKSVGEVIVPRSSVGIIIGKGGETIKRLANESGTKIQFKPDDDPNSAERCAVVQGTPDQITRATQMIWDLVQRSSGSQQQEVCLMHVPANKTGLVIGKGGETIKQICNESGAHVELSRDPPPNATEKVFVIKGSPYQIHCAQHIIRIKVGDIAPGTPVPPMQGAGGMGGQFQGSQYGGHGGDNGYGQPWSQNGYGGQSQYPSQPQNFAASNPMVQQSGQIAAAPHANPAVNPHTGQPDYSAQWAAYYRSQGMHEQADMIEQQMKTRTGGSAPQQPRNQYYGQS